uniref:NADH dehydrogenase subunit 4L n=1 Tax=Heterorhabditis bacteriophora TaxID=37862 RepID=A0A1I7W9E8_HETBA
MTFIFLLVSLCIVGMSYSSINLFKPHVSLAHVN